jgi:hypothetical protein
MQNARVYRTPSGLAAPGVDLKHANRANLSLRINNYLILLSYPSILHSHGHAH